MAVKRDILAEVKKLLKSRRELTTLWGVIREVHKVIVNPNYSTRELAKIIAADAVLTAMLLRVVNSAAYGLKIGNIEQAIVVLGYRRISELCTGLGAMKGVGVKSKGSFDRLGLWKHSLGTALASRLLQERFIGTQEPDLFVAGLLSNVGRVILDQYFPKEFHQIVRISRDRNIMLIDAERELLGVTHAEIGYCAATTWGLSPALANAIKHHHGPTQNEWAQVVNLGYVSAHALRVGSPGDTVLTALLPGVLERFNLDEYGVTDLIRDMAFEFEVVDPLLKAAAAER